MDERTVRECTRYQVPEAREERKSQEEGKEKPAMERTGLGLVLALSWPQPGRQAKTGPPCLEWGQSRRTFKIVPPKENY